MSSCLDSINHERSQSVGSDESWPHTGEERDTGWRVYHLAHTRERDELVRDIVTLVKENEPPARQRRTKRGRKRVHSWKKLVCMYMPADGYTYLAIPSGACRKKLLLWTCHGTMNRIRITQPYTEHIRRYLKNTWILCWKGLPHSLCIKEAGRVGERNTN